MTRKPRGGFRQGGWAPWLAAGAVAAVAYALWPEQAPLPPAPSGPPAQTGAAVMEAPPLPDASAPLEDWILAANQLMDHGHYEAARQGYTHALQLDSLNVSIWVDRGACRHALGDFAGAESDFRRALVLTPEHPTAHFNLGIVYFSRGQADSARLHFNYVISAAPGSQEAERARALLASPAGP